jgi:RimJ/RimL family protein N-acetyltransferase
MPASVTLEPIAPHHADAVQRLAADPDVVATTNLPEPYPEDGAAQWIAYVQPRHAAGEEFAFAIMNEDSELVGVTGLVDVTAIEAELGFWVGKPYWNRGYATAAVRQTLHFAFEAVGLERVFARPLVRNAPSRRVLEKLGFQFQQTETHEHPKWTDADRFARYRIDRSGWSGWSAAG